MAWPININHVSCYGFSRNILPVLIRVIDDHSVQWINNTTILIGGVATGRFRFAECIWELEETNETVRSVKLIEGTVNSEDLTAAVLKI